MKIVYVILFLMNSVLLLGCSTNETKQVNNINNNEIVIIAHGLGRSDTSMWRLSQHIESTGFTVCELDYSSIGESVSAILTSTEKQIDSCIGNATTVHFVGHSLGGLVIRAYLQKNQTLVSMGRLGQIVLLGTPNKGSELADYYKDSWLMGIIGEIGEALTTGKKVWVINLPQKI